MKRILPFILVFNLFFGYSQNSKIPFETISLPPEVNTNQVFCFLQTGEGFLWMGSRDGLIRYDGYKTVKILANFHGNTSHSFGDVSCLIEYDKETIWIGTHQGVYEYNRITGIAKKINKFENENLNLRNLYKTKSGEIVVGALTGLFIYNPHTDKVEVFRNRKGFDKSISNNIIRCIYEDSDNTLWVGTYDELNKLDRKRGTFKRFNLKKDDKSDLLQNNLILSIEEIEKNGKKILLVGTETGLVIFDKTTEEFEVFKQGPKINELSNSVVKTIEVVDEDEIWLGTDRGLNIFNINENTFQKYFANFNNSKSIANNIIQEIFKDSQGNVWLGTNNGVNKTFVNEVGFFHNQLKKGAPYFDKSVEVTGVVEDKNGDKWFATSEGFCCLNNQSKKYEWYKISEILSTKISDILIDKKGDIWLATPQGLHVFNPRNKTFKSYYSDKNNPNALQTNYINTLYEDAYGNVWVGTYKGGLYKSETTKQNKVVFTALDELSLSGEQINSMSINNMTGGVGDNIWLSSDDGLKQLNIVSGEIISIDLGDNYVQTMAIENEKFLWLISGGELYRYEIDTLNMEYISSVPQEIRVMIVCEKELWFSSFRSLYRMKKDGTGLEEMSPKSTGMGDYSFAAFKDRDGHLIFGGTNGFLSFKAAEISTDTVAKKIQLTNLKILNKVVTPNGQSNDHMKLERGINDIEKLELPYSQNTFSIEFSTLNFSNQENEKYSYILEGYESKWQETSAKQHHASFTRVKPGNYVFKVKSLNGGSLSKKEIRKLSIVVHPPFWASDWAMLIYLLALFAILWMSRKLLISRVNDINSLKFEKLQRVRSDELIRSKTRFFTNISHELKTPLTLIFSPTERLLKEETDEKKIATLEIIKRNTERLIRLVNQVLDVRKIESGTEKLNLENYDLVMFTKRLLSLFDEESAYRNIQIKFSSDIEKLEMHFDMTKVEKIIFNLVSNAFKFTQDEGKIKVKISVIKRDEIEFARIEIKDTGVGISEKNQKLIFERFTNINTKNFTSQEGTGIGLSLVNDYVELHKGFVRLKSKTDKGSTFSINLPLNLNELNAEGNVAVEKLKRDKNSDEFELEEQKMEQSGKLKLLIVEDDRDMRSFIDLSFNDEFDLILAPDGKEGYQKALLNHPDIIISDVMMPKMDGITLCKKLKGDVRTSHIPIILLTAKGGHENKMEGIGAGADDYIQKPFHLDYLLLRTKMLISKREKVQEDYLKEDEISVSEIVNNPLDERFLNDLLSVLEKELDNSELSVQLLAELLQIDKTSLYRKVKSLTGQTATAFIRHTRLKKAAQLLKSDNLNVSEVMYMVGYTHRSYFTRSFKELFGMVPTEYKAKLQDAKK